MFRNMEYVYAVYQEMSFSRAAERLFISQPALSAMIKKIEARIGSPIFDRSCSPIRLTACGREYISCVEQMMDMESQFRQYLNQTESLAVGSLSIGANSVFASYLLPGYIFAFSRRHPGVQVSMMEGNTNDLLTSLNSGDIDIVLENYELPDDLYDKHYLLPSILLSPRPKLWYSINCHASICWTCSSPVSRQTGTPRHAYHFPCWQISHSLRCVPAMIHVNALTGYVHVMPSIQKYDWSWTSSLQLTKSHAAAWVRSSSAIRSSSTRPPAIPYAISDWMKTSHTVRYISTTAEKNISPVQWRNFSASA